MIASLFVTVIAAGIAFAFLYALWLLTPVFYGLAWLPTEHRRIRKALELARLRRGETLYDLGAGDGRILIIAAREFGAQAVGIEISPLHCFVAWLSARFNQLNITIRREDFFKADLRDADVVFAYMTSKQAKPLRLRLESQLRPGARVVTVSFDFDGWQPTAVDRENLIFLYQMPATPGSLDSFLAQKL